MSMHVEWTHLQFVAIQRRLHALLAVGYQLGHGSAVLKVDKTVITVLAVP